MSTSAPLSPLGSLAKTLNQVAIVSGVLSVVLGIMVLSWPTATLLVIAVVFAIHLIVLGAFRLRSLGTLPAEPGWLKPLTAVLAVLTIAAGVICLFRPGTSLLTIALLVAVGWLSDAIGAFATAVMAGVSGGTRLLLLVTAVVLVIAAVFVVSFPGESLVLLARWAGILLIVFGGAQVVMAFMARREATSS